MKNKAIEIFLFALLFVLTTVATAGEKAPDESSLPSPRQLWQRCQKTLPPFHYDVLKDEIVRSDTDPRVQLRRLEIYFISQQVEGKKMGHDAVVFIPVQADKNESPQRQGKVVIVARPYSDKTIIGNCAEPIAARTGYPTMCIDTPGDQDGKEGEMFWLTGLRKLASDTHDPMNADLFRCAIPYLRAMDVFADLLHEKKIRAIIGGHSKRAYYAYTAAAIDPDRVASVVYMGCERLFTETEKYPDLSVSPYFAPDEKYPRSLVLFATQKYVKCPVFYIGVTNEAGFTMFNINKMVARMKDPWTIEYIPNYRHDFRSERQFIDWRMWVSHVFDGRPLAKISDLDVKATDHGTIFRANVQSKNKILQVKLWYVYCDDVPYWRDLMWYPAIMRKKRGNLYETRVGGNPPDAWFVEVKDIGRGFPGYVSSLPQNLTGKAAEERNARRPRNWKFRAKQSQASPSAEANRYFLEGRKLQAKGQKQKAIASYQKAIELDPPYAEAYWRLAGAYGGRTLEAYPKKAEALRKAMRLADRFSVRDRFAVEAEYYSMTRYRYGQAIDVYKRWLRLYPNDIDAHNGLGRLYLDIEQWDQAVSQFQWVTKSAEAGPSAYLNLASAYINPGQYDQAQQALEDCLKRFGDNAGVYLKLALVHQYQGDFATAHKIIDKAMSLYPDNPACYASKGTAYLYGGKLDKAEAEYQKMFDDLRPGFHWQGLYRLSELCLLQGKIRLARDLAQQGYEHAREHESIGQMRDRLALSARFDAIAGRPEEAIEKLDTLWKTTLVDEELEWQRFIVYCKGLIYAENGQLDKALGEASKLKKLTAIGLDKKKMRLYLHLMGVIEIEHENYAKAVEYLEPCPPMTCLRSRLNIAVADSLASAYAGAGELKKAEQQYRRMGDFPRGRQYYGDLYALSFYRLGRCYQSQSRPAEAAHSYEKFLEIWKGADPAIPEIKSASEALKQLKSWR